MQINNGVILHCVACGRVAHVDLGDAAPQCCNQAMEIVAEEKVDKKVCETGGDEGPSDSSRDNTRPQAPR